MKSFFSYYGGKQKIAQRIIKLIPDHSIYVEPFAGGGAVLATMGWKKVKNCNHYRAVLNDSNSLIYNFYKVLQEQPFEFFERLAFIPYSERIYHEVKDTCKSGDGDPLDLAIAFYCNVCFSYANKLNAGYGRSRVGKNDPFTFNFHKKRLFGLLDIISKCYVTNTDALDCIKRWDTVDTFFYIDPPYVGTNQGHYAGYTQEDLGNLIELLKDIKGSFILSGYENPAYPETWERIEIQTSAGSACGINGAGKSKRTEVILRKLNQTPKETDANTQKNQTFKQVTVDPRATSSADNLAVG